jgi:hypothetical protein
MLKFTCPKCGKNELDLVKIDMDLIYPVLEISETKDFVYEQPIINEFNNGKVIAMQCANCTHVITGKDHKPLIDQEDIRDWVKENCRQE